MIAIFLNGDYEDDAFYAARYAAASLVVAADGGYAFLRRLGLRSHVLVGDFDSLDAGLVAEAEASGVEVVRHPVRKDQTDAELAVVQAVRRSLDGIELLGALGGAFDHQLGHVSLLRNMAAAGRSARIAAPGFAMRVFYAPAHVALGAPSGTRVSLVALSPAAVVTLRGLEYPLTNAPLAATSCLGLSNEIARSGATVTLASGVLAVMVLHGDETFAGERER